MDYLLDTSVIIAYLRRRPGVVEYITSLEGELSTSFVCVAELYEGVYKSLNSESAESGIQVFCSGLSDIFSLDFEIAKTFGRIKTTLQSIGQVIDDLDILIATTALTRDKILITLNIKHFSRIPGLKILTPPHSSSASS